MPHYITPPLHHQNIGALPPKNGSGILSSDFIFVISAFSSGSTAVTGILMNLGVVALGPLSRTNDPRTQTSLESIALQRLCDDLVSEDALQIWEGKRLQIVPKLVGFKREVEAIISKNSSIQGKPIVFKRPTTAIFLKEIDLVFKPKFVFVYRDLAEIERSKVRRGWNDCHGRWGAKIINSHMRSFAASSHEPFTVHFEDVRNNPRSVAEAMAREFNLNPTEEMLQAASNWISDHIKHFGIEVNKTGISLAR